MLFRCGIKINNFCCFFFPCHKVPYGHNKGLTFYATIKYRNIYSMIPGVIANSYLFKIYPWSFGQRVTYLCIEVFIEIE